ncbi:LytR/AlgR family response regulator transcription factor [Luteibaculum oceani]|uniref:Response regulator transcription factor n=1 Tax=Luteibaculum oceani TaxID=1294296 RepID=A0A5C6V0G3_9FLAO|nr:response regulator transcription factor [Luteibaculum oceani]TXC78669.1 response regulator transcription factor [Luteibaculum oceani]
MNVLIVEDELLVADHIADIIQSQGANVVGLARDVEEASTFLNSHTLDLIFLDIFLENSNGIDFGRKLRNTHPNIPFIFLTANIDKETLREAVDCKPFSYISKPFQETDIIAAIELIKSSNHGTNGLKIKSSDGMVDVPFNEIFYIVADGVYCNIHTEKRSYLHRASLTELMNLLPHAEFQRTHRSYIVNRNHIQAKKSDNLIVANELIPVSKSYRNLF